MWKLYIKYDGKEFRHTQNFADYVFNEELVDLCRCDSCEGIALDKSKKVQICKCGRTKLEYVKE